MANLSKEIQERFNKLRTSFEGIRDERNLYANTATRIGKAFLDLLDFFANGVNGQYISRISEDTAQETITFLKGIKIDDLWSWDKNGNIIANKATLEKLLVKGAAIFQDYLSSPKFVSGFLEGLGWRLSPETVVNAAGVQEQRYTLEIDNVIVRGILRVFEMVISQLLGENDNRIFTAMLEVDHYDAATGKVYLDTMEGRYYNPFRKDDIIMVQQYNGMPSEENDYYVTKRYELVITEVGSEGSGEDMLAWVKFKNFTSSMENATPENLIKKKDTFVRVDNLTDSERKGIITIMTVGKDTPYEDIIYGLKTDPDNALKGRLGNLKGIIHPLFGALQGFGELLMNLYATGDLILRRTGENIDTKFQVLENMFSTNYTKTEYELTDEDNYLHNGQFLTKYSDSDDAELIDGWKIDSDEDTAFWIDESGMPVLVNDNVAVGGNRRAFIERKDGRQLLRLTNIGITQANSLIKQPKTHKEYVKPTGSAKTDTDDEGNTSENGLKTATDGSSKDVQDKLYVTMRIYALTQGTLTIGFTGCTDKEGLTNELASREQAISYSGKWQTVTFNGVWNGTGDFVIRYTGDCRIAFIAITDTALANLSKTVSTSIEQTAEAIKLLGYNDDKLHGQYTSLGIIVDALDKKIELYNSTAETKEEAEEQRKKLEDLINSVDTKAGNNATLIEQLSDRVGILAGHFDSSGHLTELSGYITTAQYNALVSSVSENESQVQSQLDTLNNLVGDVPSGENLASLIKQNAAGISALAGHFDSSGHLTELSGYITTAQYNALVSSVSENESQVQSQLDTLNNLVGDVPSGENLASLIKQNAAGISALAGHFDSSGHLTELGNYALTSTVNTLYNSRFNSDGTLVTKTGLVTATDWNSFKSQYDGDISSLTNKFSNYETIDAANSLYTTITNEYGQKITSSLLTYVKKTDNGNGTYSLESGVYIGGDQITIDANHKMNVSVAGALVISTDNFILDESGNATLNGTFTTGSGDGKITISATDGIGSVMAGGWVDVGYNNSTQRSFGSLITSSLPDYGGHVIVTSKSPNYYFGTSVNSYTTEITGLSVQTNYLFAKSLWVGSLVLGTPVKTSSIGSMLQTQIDANLISALIMTNTREVTVTLPANPVRGQIFVVVQRGSSIKFSSAHGIWSAGYRTDASSGTLGQWNCFMFDGDDWIGEQTNQHL